MRRLKPGTGTTILQVLKTAFLFELAAGTAALFFLNHYYKGVMDAGFLIAIPLLGIFSCYMFPGGSSVRAALYRGMQVFVLLFSPVIFWLFLPSYSYDQAKAILQARQQPGTHHFIDSSEKHTFALINSGNPFISRAYYFLMNEHGQQAEYVVNPHDGKVSKLTNH